MRTMMCFLAMLVSMVLCSTVWGGDYNFFTGVDSKASSLEARAGVMLDENWDVGLYGTYFTKDPSHDWGAGAYARMIVDPEATVPLAGWFPTVGSWLNLPETLPAETYLIGKMGVLPLESGVDLAACLGAGASVGPVCLECTYDILESGDADIPNLTSGLKVVFGLRFQF